MSTRTRNRPYNLSLPQSQHLGRCGRVLVVEACRIQPDFDVTRVAIGRDGITKFFGRLGGGTHYLDYDQPAPYQPGDVVPCRERWAFGICETGDANGFCYESDGLDSFSKKWYPANSMPNRAIRYRPVVESVECRRVATITNDEAESAAFGNSRCGDVLFRPIGTFKNDWHRRHRRRGDEFAFDKAWAWFYQLVLKGNT